MTTNVENKNDLNITAMPTPNPNTVMFTIDHQFFNAGSLEFSKKEEAQSSELPKQLFEIEGVSGVMIGTNFISVSKIEDADWEAIFEQTIAIIKATVGTIEEVIDPELLATMDEVNEEDSESVQKIKKILDEEIRPAIAMDGGDCQFHSFQDGVLTLKLQGACSTCPASVMTLKMGIENRLKEEVSDLKEVIQL
mgnify:CR=1 FL=1